MSDFRQNINLPEMPVNQFLARTRGFTVELIKVDYLADELLVPFRINCQVYFALSSVTDDPISNDVSVKKKRSLLILDRSEGASWESVQVNVNLPVWCNTNYIVVVE